MITFFIVQLGAMKKRSKKTEIVHVRVTPVTKKALKKRARMRFTTISQEAAMILAQALKR